MKPPTTEAIDVVLEHADSLRTLCEIFFDHKHHAIYRSIAGALRLLLVGSSGDKGLVAELCPGAQFHPLRITPALPFAADHLTVPADVTIVRPRTRLQLAAGSKVQSLDVKDGAVRAMVLTELFDLAAPPLPLTYWLAQPFLWSDRTLGKFIQTIANKDGVAHLAQNDDLLAVKRWGHLHWHLVAHVGWHIIAPITAQVAAAFPGHVRAVR